LKTNPAFKISKTTKIHRGTEKRTNFLLFVSLLILDRNW